MTNEADSTVGFRTREFISDIGDDIEQQLQLFGGSPKVFHRQQINGHEIDVYIITPADHLADLFGTHSVPMADISEARFPGPASVAITHDGNVTGLFGAV